MKKTLASLLAFAVFAAGHAQGKVTLAETKNAAAQGNAEAQYNLGFAYSRGYSLEIQDYPNRQYNEVEAVKWFKKAAEQGHADAQYELGKCYGNGKGVDEDCVESVKWNRKAAEQGNAWAQRAMGSAYYFGSGVDKDRTESVKWYRKAAAQGNAGAREELQRFTPDEIEAAERALAQTQNTPKQEIAVTAPVAAPAPPPAPAPAAKEKSPLKIKSWNPDQDPPQKVVFEFEVMTEDADPLALRPWAVQQVRQICNDEYAQDGKSVLGFTVTTRLDLPRFIVTATILRTRLMSYSYDAVARTGTIKMNIGQRGDANFASSRKWVIDNIGEVCSGKGIAMEAGKAPPPGALYSTLSEAITDDGMLEVAFRVEMSAADGEAAVDIADLMGVALRATRELLVHPSVAGFEKENSRKPRIDVGAVINATRDRINVDQVTERIAEELLNSQQITLVAHDLAAVRANKLDKFIDNAQINLQDQADYYLEGTVSKQVSTKDDRVETTYTFMLRLNDRNRSQVWKRTLDITKQSDR